MYEIHVQRRRKISMRASGRPSYIDIIVIALLEMSVVVDSGVCVWPGTRVFGRRVSGRTWPRQGRGGRVEASLCKGDGQLGNPGIPMAGGCRIRYILRNCFCKIVREEWTGPEPVAHQSLMDVRLYWKEYRTSLRRGHRLDRLQPSCDTYSIIARSLAQFRKHDFGIKIDKYVRRFIMHGLHAQCVTPSCYKRSYSRIIFGRSSPT